MIEKIVRLIISGTDVKEILAVTFTKKAAAQMKEKLRRELVRAINDPSATAERRAALRKQLSEVPGADISTIHSFCSRLIRAHFFAAGVDGGFSVIAGDDAEGTELKSKALDEVFENAYEEGEERFTRLLSVYWRKKSDNRLRGVLSDLYEELRQRADYREFLKNSVPFTEEKFDRIAGELFALLKEKCAWYAALAESELKYFSSVGREKSERNAKEILSALAEIRASADYFPRVLFPAPRSAKRKEEKRKTARKWFPISNALPLSGIKSGTSFRKTRGYGRGKRNSPHTCPREKLRNALRNTCSGSTIASENSNGSGHCSIITIWNMWRCRCSPCRPSPKRCARDINMYLSTNIRM